MNKKLLKEAIKKIIKPMINEISIDPMKSYGMADPDKFIGEIGKDVKASNAIINFNRENGKITIQDETGGNAVSVELIPTNDKSKCYNLTAIYNKSDREHLNNLSIDDVREFIKTCFKEGDKKSYVEKAYDKNVMSVKKEDIDNKKEADSDQCVEVKKIKKQIDFAPKDNKDRKVEEIIIGISTMEDGTKYKKQSDAQSKEKMNLKADKKNASDEKIVKKFK